jgi:hypothetical protein
LVDTLRNVRVVRDVTFSRTYDVSLKVIVLKRLSLCDRNIWLDLLELGHWISRDRLRARGNRRVQGHCALQY